MMVAPPTDIPNKPIRFAIDSLEERCQFGRRFRGRGDDVQHEPHVGYANRHLLVHASGPFSHLEHDLRPFCGASGVCGTVVELLCVVGRAFGERFVEPVGIGENRLSLR